VALPSGVVLPIDPVAAEPRLFRSVLFFPEGTREVFAGTRAIDEYLARADGRFLQSLKGWLASASFRSTNIRNRAITLEDLCGSLLRRIREQAEAAAGHSLERAVIGRPALFSDDPEADALAERRLRAAALAAGWTEIELVIEPIAAALAYEADLKRDELVLVGDFGAGTSDFTLMRLGPSGRGRKDRRGDILASGGVAIGGDRIDAAIMRHKLLPHFGGGSTYDAFGKRMPMPMAILGKLLAWHELSFLRDRTTEEMLDRILQGTDAPKAIEALQDLVSENLGYRLFRAIEAAKVALSKAAHTQIRFDEARIQLDEPITRVELESFVAPLLERFAETVSDVIRRAGVDDAQIDAIFLTGGTSQIPSVHALFETRFGRDRLRSADAFTSVAEGLGRSAGATG